MLAQDSYDAVSTSVKLACIPNDATGIERIMLAAQGDLQRLLSAFFGRPIYVKCIYANTSSRLRPASPEYCIMQSRQVHLICANQVVCIATSIVTITSPESERLFLDDGFPIGQTFRQLHPSPQFSLLDVATLNVRGKRELHRLYTLETKGLKTLVLEVFPDRDMFSHGEDWLCEESSRASAVDSSKLGWCSNIQMSPVIQTPDDHHYAIPWAIEDTQTYPSYAPLVHASAIPYLHEALFVDNARQPEHGLNAL